MRARAVRPYTLVVAVALTSVSLLLPVALDLPQARASQTYYVAPSGSAPSSDPSPGDCSGGTKDDPWGSPYVRSDGVEIHQIEYAMRCLTAGDTLVIRGGTYTDRALPFLVEENRGTRSAPVRVGASPGEHVVLRGLLRLDQADHWHISGINVTNDGGAYGSGEYLLKMLGGTGWSVSGSEVWGTRGSYAAVRIERSSAQTGPNVNATAWTFRGNCVHGTAPANGSGQDHNMYIHTGPGGSGTVERNVFFDAPNGQNIKLGNGLGKGEDRTDDVAIRHNVLYDARQNVMVVGDSSNNTIERNLLGRVLGEGWYPNVRGYSLTGPNNAVRSNAGFTGNAQGELVFVGNESSGHPSSTQSFSASSNLFPVAPVFDDTTGCSGFYPTKGAYRPYGAYAPVSSGDPIERIAGAGREQTSVEISKRSFPSSGSAKTVVVARSDDYPDALAGGPLAAALDAPILLTGGDRLDAAVANEVERLGADDAVLLGGEAALSEQVRRDLRGLGLAVRRVEGANRFATAAQVGNELAKLESTDVENAYVVEGADPDPNRGWPDAVAVGSLAAQQGRPILLVTTETLPEDTRRALGDLAVDRATIVGGGASVSDSVAEAITDVGPSVDRIAGASRFETSRRVTEAAHRAGADPARVWFATGGSFPDALAAGPAVARDGGVLLLVPGYSTFLNGEATHWIDRFRGGMQELKLIGGPAAIRPAIEDKARHQLLFGG